MLGKRFRLKPAASFSEVKDSKGYVQQTTRSAREHQTDTPVQLGSNDVTTKQAQL